MAGFKQRLADARERSPHLDHAIRTVQHYGSVGGSQQAAAVTYFGFLSVFPVLALALFVVGYIARVDDAARDALATAVGEVLPGLIGDGDHQLSLHDIQNSAATAGLVGLIGVLYAGLGWLSALRAALMTVFEQTEDKPGFVMGKLRDLSALVVLGVVLLVGVGVSGGISELSDRVLDALGLSRGLGWLVAAVAIAVGVAAGALMFFLMFWLLARPPLPQARLWQGAILAAVGFEALKQLSSVLLAATRGQPAFQAFGIALILLVWINYFSQLTLYAASWAHTASRSGDGRTTEAPDVAEPTDAEKPAEEPTGVLADTRSDASGRAVSAGLGAAGMLGIVALVKRKRRS